MIEERKAKVLFNKSGGNASRNAVTNRITIPTSWIKEMGITRDNREVVLEFKEGVITIKKASNEKHSCISE